MSRRLHSRGLRAVGGLAEARRRARMATADSSVPTANNVVFTSGTASAGDCEGGCTGGCDEAECLMSNGIHCRCPRQCHCRSADSDDSDDDSKKPAAVEESVGLAPALVVRSRGRAVGFRHRLGGRSTVSRSGVVATQASVPQGGLEEAQARVRAALASIDSKSAIPDDAEIDMEGVRVDRHTGIAIRGANMATFIKRQAWRDHL